MISFNVSEEITTYIYVCVLVFTKKAADVIGNLPEGKANFSIYILLNEVSRAQEGDDTCGQDNRIGARSMGNRSLLPKASFSSSSGCPLASIPDVT